jgi:hypothetical protein
MLAGPCFGAEEKGAEEEKEAEKGVRDLEPGALKPGGALVVTPSQSKTAEFVTELAVDPQAVTTAIVAAAAAQVAPPAPAAGAAAAAAPPPAVPAPAAPRPGGVPSARVVNPDGQSAEI